MTNVINKQPLTLTTPASIKNGDHTAFLTAYNDLHIKVFRFFSKRVFSNDTSKDLTQQTFIRLWQFRQTLSDQHTLEKQVFVIAHSLLVNYFAGEEHQQKIKMRQHLHALDNLHTPPQNESFEVADQVKAAMEQLSPARKKVLELKAFHDYSNLEIAGQLNISVKTVEDHITKAFRRMKEVIMLSCVILLLNLFS